MQHRVVAFTRQVELVALVAVLLGVTLGATIVILHGDALGWDESVYAVAARSMVTDIPDTVSRAYRPPGLPVLGSVAFAAGFRDAGLRGVSLALGIAALLAAWSLGRVVFGPRTALLGLLGTVSAGVVWAELPLFHNDLASAGLLLLVMALLWWQLEVRPAPGPALLLAAPLVAAAFYLRYGVVAGVIGIALGAAILWWRTLWRHRGLAASLVGLTTLLVLPHVAYAMALYGRPWGILTLAAGQVNTSSPLRSAATYLRLLPGDLGGPLSVVYAVAAAGLVLALVVRRATGRGTWDHGRPVAWLLVPAVTAAAGTIAVSHAEARYVLFALIPVTIIGARALELGWSRVVGALPATPRTRAVASVVAGGLLVALTAAVGGLHVRADSRGAAAQAWVRDPAEAIASATERPCVVATTLRPKVAWYSGCATVQLAGSSLARLQDWPAGSRWVMLTSDDASRVGAATVATFDALVTDPPLASREQGPNWGRAYPAPP